MAAGNCYVPCPEDYTDPESALFPALVKRFDRAHDRVSNLRDELAEAEAVKAGVLAEIDTALSKRMAMDKAARKRGYYHETADNDDVTADLSAARRIANAVKIEKRLTKAQLPPAQIANKENVWKWRSNAGKFECVNGACGPCNRSAGYWQCRYDRDVRMCGWCMDHEKRFPDDHRDLVKMYNDQREHLLTILADEHRMLYRYQCGETAVNRVSWASEWRMFSLRYADDLLDVGKLAKLYHEDECSVKTRIVCTFGGKECTNVLCAALIGHPGIMACAKHLVEKTVP